MKSWTTFLILIFLFNVNLLSQSATLTLEPDFTNRSGIFVSEVMKVDHRHEKLSFVGISCYHSDKEYQNIQYRLLENERWSRWYDFRPQHEEGKRARTAYQGELITAEFSAVQFKTAERLNSRLVVRLFFGVNTAAGNLNSIPRSSECEQPDFCNRECWCADCPVDATPQFTDPTHIIVHHSAGSNADDLNFAEVAHFIWDLHVNTNGWDDIGYNWLIDRNGVIYEGRPDNYQGAHFSCLNENTVGICLLGNFSNTLPTDKAITTLIDLIGYEATVHDIDVLSESYHVKGDFDLVNVAGHRDSAGSDKSCSSTECPGDAFYPLLDSIRLEAANLACYQNEVSNTSNLHEQTWTIYPNPFHSTINVNGGASQKIRLVDIYGRTATRLIPNVENDLSHLSQGFYFVVAGGSVIEKVLKH